MRRSAIFLLFMMVILLSLLGERGASDSAISTVSLYNSLLPPNPFSEPNLEFVALLDGTVHLFDTSSKKALWWMSSGLPIYSSYQAFPVNVNGKLNASELSEDFYYVDVGDDWQLYQHSKRYGKMQKLPLTPEDYVKMTPIISKEGEITLGFKKTTVFIVDARTGRVVRTCGSDVAPSPYRDPSSENSSLLLVRDAELMESAPVDLGTVENLVYITRTDYVLKQYSPISGEDLWNLAFADFEAEFRCQGVRSSLGGISDEGIDGVEFPCQMKTHVHRIRDHSFLEADKLGVSYLGGRAHFLPKPYYISSDRYGHQLALPGPEAKLSEYTSLAIPDKVPQVIAANSHLGPGRDANLTGFGAINSLDTKSYVVPVAAAILSIIGSVFVNYLTFRKWSNKPVEELKSKGSVPKKKKGKRSTNSKSNSSDDSRQKYLSIENTTMENGGNSSNARKSLMAFFDVVDGHVNARQIGKLLVFNKEIARGSNGTVVLEGNYDGRPVAVKRLVQTHHDVALKEIQNLIASDQHPNIVRWFGVEHDQDFVYLALERCTCSLNDFIHVNSESFQSGAFRGEVDASLLPDRNNNLELWKPNGHPSAHLLKLMRDVVAGVAHLHELGIIHRDLKPQNVLIINDKSFCAKISDMGISKRLVEDMSSLTHHTTGHGSSGWRAPEQLLRSRQSRAVDLFSLGCLLFFCVTGGKHPFGENIERDVNIVNDRKDLFLVENIPEGVHLFSGLLDPNPDKRPKAQEVLNHPFFWTYEKRLSFLQDISDRVELEDRKTESELLDALESIGPMAIDGKWDEKLEAAFINNIGRYRRYKYDSIRDLLRVIRNKSHHYRELPEEIKELLGSHPEGFENYFSCRFPKLLIEVYKVMYEYCKEEEFFRKYIQPSII